MSTPISEHFKQKIIDLTIYAILHRVQWLKKFGKTLIIQDLYDVSTPYIHDVVARLRPAMYDRSEPDLITGVRAADPITITASGVEWMGAYLAKETGEGIDGYLEDPMEPDPNDPT